MPWGSKKRDDAQIEVLFDSAGVDVVSLSADETIVELHIVSDAPWTGSDDQITSLQQKIHNYVAFAVDGQLAATYPDVAGLPWQIVIRCLSGAPDPRTADVLDRTREPVQQHGGDLKVSA